VVVDVPHGPRKIGPKNQVSLPGELLAAIGVEQGEDVWVAVNTEPPGTLIVMPARIMETVFRSGLSAVLGEGRPLS